MMKPNIHQPEGDETSGFVRMFEVLTTLEIWIPVRNKIGF